jgi:hypothetical protein
MHVAPPGSHAIAASIDEFSDRELAVLRMLSGDMSQREIGGAPLHLVQHGQDAHEEHLP